MWLPLIKGIIFTDQEYRHLLKNMHTDVLPDGTGDISQWVNDKHFSCIHSLSYNAPLVFWAVYSQDNLDSFKANIQRLMTVFSVVTLTLVFIYILWTYKYVHHPLLNIVNAFQQIEAGNINIKLDI